MPRTIDIEDVELEPLRRALSLRWDSVHQARQEIAYGRIREREQLAEEQEAIEALQRKVK